MLENRTDKPIHVIVLLNASPSYLCHPQKKRPGSSGQCDSTRGDSLSGRTPPPARAEGMPKGSTVPFPELATCRLMDWPEGLQAGENFSKELDSFPAQRASRVRFEFQACSAPQGSRPPRPPAPSPSLLKPCLHSRPISVPAAERRSANEFDLCNFDRTGWLECLTLAGSHSRSAHAILTTEELLALLPERGFKIRDTH